MVEDATVEAQARQDELDEQPQGDRQGFRLFKNFLPELEANNGFRDHDDEEHPALSSHTFAASIRHVRVVLPEIVQTSPINKIQHKRRLLNLKNR